MGSDATLDVATWNIEWFGSSTNGPSDEARQLTNVRAVLEGSGVDLWAVQEIANESAWEALLAELGPDYDGRLTPTRASQRFGFIYRKDVIRPAAHRVILQSFDHSFAGRPPWLLEANVTLPDTSLRVTFITLHMKAFGDVSSYERRADASNALKNHIDHLMPNAPVIVLGDFNDRLRSSITGGYGSPYRNFVQDPDQYVFTTTPLDQANLPTWCSNSTCSSGTPLDHILITDELFGAYESASTDRYIELVQDISSYRSTTSDHLPVYARFKFKSTTNIGTPQLPAGIAIGAPYPNPFTDAVRIPFNLDRPSHVRIEVYDLLGRRVSVAEHSLHPPGSHETLLEGAGLTPGVYLVRYAIEDVSAARLITLIE